MIEILSTSALATVQDAGRRGNYRHGVGMAGAMDGLALAIGNVLLGNSPDAAAIEVPVTPFRVRFDRGLSCAVTGADCAPVLDGVPLPPDWAFHAKAGQVLALGPTQTGCRAYLCVHGGIDVPDVLGSRSTQLREGFGGFEGRTLQRGDVLGALGGDAGLPPGGLGAIQPAKVVRAGAMDATAVRVLPAAEYPRFTQPAQGLFWDSRWKVTAQSNRAGYRLAGPALELDGDMELRSHGVVPGVIQVPPGGQPIIQLADAATMGGYPKIGTVIEADLWRVAQVRPGDALAFVETDYAQAVAALEALEAHVAAIDATARLQRENFRRADG